MALTVWGDRLEEVLADGKWHELEDVLAAVVRLVPPGMAYRKGEWNRGRRPDAPGARHVGARDRSVATGARIIARKSIESRLRRGTLERRGTRIRRAR